MKTLVTGATGHLGANLVRRLLDDGHAVRALLREKDPPALAGLDVEQVTGDLRDPAACRAAVRGCEGVHHTAAVVSTIDGDAQHKRDIFEINVLGTRHLLDAARAEGVAKVVVTGSLSATGHDPARPSDETMPFDPLQKHLPYGRSKAAVEHECLKAFADGLPVVIATSCAILGPHDYKPSRMGRLLLDFAHGQLRAYVPGGFEFVAARDMANGHALAMAKGRPGQKYIICTQFMTVDQLLDIYEEVTGQKRPALRIPGPVMSAIAEVSDIYYRWLAPTAPRRFTPAAVRFLRMERRADCSKAKQELGFAPTTIREAIRDAFDDFVRRGLITKASAPAVAAGVHA